MLGDKAGGGDSQLSLQTYLTRVTRVRLKLQQVTNAPDPQEMTQQLAQTVLQGKTVDLTDTRDYDGESPPVWARNGVALVRRCSFAR